MKCIFHSSVRKSFSVYDHLCLFPQRCCGRDGWRRIHPPSGLCSEQNPFPVSCSSHYKHCCFAGLLHASSFPSQGTQRRTFSDTQTGHRTSANHSSIEVSGENIYITLQKKKKDEEKCCSTPSAPSEAGWRDCQRGRAVCMGLQGVCEWQSWRRIPATKPGGNRSQAGGARAEEDSDVMVSWLQCLDCSSQVVWSGAAFQPSAAAQPGPCHKLPKEAVNREVKGAVPLALWSPHLSPEHRSLLFQKETSAKIMPAW